MRVWVLNFDAERELESRAGAHTSDAATRARARGLEARLAGLVAEGDVVVHGPEDVVAAHGHVRAAWARGESAEWVIGEAWCPTPSARRLLATVGAHVPRAPSIDVLRAVNARAFSAALGQTLPGAAFVRTVDEAEAVARGPSPTGQWLAKRAFGFAGRGRRRMHAGPLSAHDRTFVVASLRRGDGLQMEPWVLRTRDYGLHGWLDADGRVHLGDLTVQACDDEGAWLSTELASPEAVAQADREAVVASAREAARALHAAGYFGPFGVDAYAWREHASGPSRLNPRSEINARYSMGWAVGMRRWRASR